MKLSALSLSLSLCALIVVEPEVRAQSGSLPRYRILSIGDLSGGSGPPTAWISRAYGINNLGQVVGAANAEPYEFDFGHAALWLPSPAYGQAFVVEGLTDLTALAGSALDGMARDINVHGKVIGTQASGSPGLPDVQAFIWELDLHPSSTWAYPLGTICDPDVIPCSMTASFGLAINDSDPGVVVGESIGLVSCLGGEGGTGFGFRRTVGYVGALDVLLPLGDGDNVSTAFGIGTPESPFVDPQIVGVSRSCGTATPPCQGSTDPVLWQPVLSGEAGPDLQLIELSSEDGSAPAGVALDINDDPVEAPGEPERQGEAVGYCVVRTLLPTGWACVSRAADWPQVGLPAIDLHVIAGFVAEAESLAAAIANPDSQGVTRIVGANLSENRAWKWERSDTLWSAAQLDTLIWSGCAWEQLLDARDVNDHGWIVGTGDNDPTATTLIRGYVLIPEPCFADFTGDGLAEGADLGILLGAFNIACPNGVECTYCRQTSSCPWDLNCDGFVDGADLGIFLGWWDQCQPSDGGGQMQTMAASGIGAVGLDAALLAVGFSSLSDFQVWAETEPAEKVLGVAMLMYGLLMTGETP